MPVVCLLAALLLASAVEPPVPSVEPVPEVAPARAALPIPPGLELVSESARFRVRALPGARTLAEALAKNAEVDRDAIAAEFGADWDGVTEVWVVPQGQSFDAVLPPSIRVPEWARGVAFASWNLVILRPPAERSTLRHELSHIAVGRLSSHPVPRWFLEGIATIHAGDLWERKGPSLVRAALADGLFAFESLADRFPSRPSDVDLAYAQSADFVQFIADRHGEEALREVLREVVDGETFDTAVLRVTGETARALENEWRRSMARWELLMRSMTSPGLWWGLLSVLVVLAWLRMRWRRGLRLKLMELEERADALLAQEAILLERARELEAAGQEDLSFEEELFGPEEPPHEEPPPAAGQKKPTLH